MAAKLEEARAELRSEFAIDRDKAMGELHKEYLASRLHSEAFDKCVARCQVCRAEDRPIESADCQAPRSGEATAKTGATARNSHPAQADRHAEGGEQGTGSKGNQNRVSKTGT